VRFDYYTLVVLKAPLYSWEGVQEAVMLEVAALNDDDDLIFMQTREMLLPLAFQSVWKTPAIPSSEEKPVEHKTA
jgi:hypothetical protein